MKRRFERWSTVSHQTPPFLVLLGAIAAGAGCGSSVPLAEPSPVPAPAAVVSPVADDNDPLTHVERLSSSSSSPARVILVVRRASSRRSRTTRRGARRKTCVWRLVVSGR